MNSYVLGLYDIDKTKVMAAGGKGANLGELIKVEGIYVPDGFCIITDTYQRIIAEAPQISSLLDRLSNLSADDRDKIAGLCGEIRNIIVGTAIPEDIREEIMQSLASLGEKEAYAVRSSATAEDLPQASFAGQQDTYLNIIGNAAILKHISKCWASLFTDRAVIYRIQNGFDHRKVSLAVVVQKMVFPQVSGIMFTADPVTSSSKVLTIDAGFGLGEALVSGLTNADVYKVMCGRITGKKISIKKLALYPDKDGGINEREVEPGRQNRQALTDEQILRLERIGRKIEEHFGSPQDIEWCLADDTFYIVQSRPVTTLYPIPQAKDLENHVYVSVGHNQMMTDPIKPLGLSFFLMTTNAPMHKAGGRLFVDVTNNLASPSGRNMLLDTFGKFDPLIKDALETVIERGNFIRFIPDEENKQAPGGNKGTPSSGLQEQAEIDPAIVSDLIRRNQTSINELKQSIQFKTGSALFDFIVEDMQRLKMILFDPHSTRVFMAAIQASSWINEKMEEWLGEKNAADTLSQSVPNNVTSEMGLALLDAADVIRPYPDVIDYLQRVKDEPFLDELKKFRGGQEASNAIHAYLDKYGMRCVGEIDITKTRWSEKPAALIPMILSNIKNFEPGEGSRRFMIGRQEALKKEQELLDRLKILPNGEQKAGEAKRMISLIRNFIGYREYPKYGMISRYFVYKQALMKEAEKLVQADIIHEKEDIYYLTFEELREAVASCRLDYSIIGVRKDEYKRYEKLNPPRVITSDGEIIAGKYKRGNLPADAIIGLPVSSGVAEGRARIILNMEEASLSEGDILVTAYTDPSWTPLFVSIKGLVTEVGGLMTHGAVIAREYGLPAVVGIENATRLFTDGQRIRVNGTDGYIEIL